MMKKKKMKKLNVNGVPKEGKYVKLGIGFVQVIVVIFETR